MERISLRRRNGMEHLTMRVLCRSLAPFMRCRCDPVENLPQEPLIFCCNHYEMFGPIAAALSLPVRFKFMMNADPFRQLDPIPVSEGLSNVIAEMDRTAREMQAGNSIVIFPECGVPSYSIGSVTEFREGFAIIGEFYRKRTVKDAVFCPAYIDKWEKRIHFGELVTYGNAPVREECAKVSQKLYDSLTAMAEVYGHSPQDCPEECFGEREAGSVHG